MEVVQPRRLLDPVGPSQTIVVDKQEGVETRCTRATIASPSGTTEMVIKDAKARIVQRGGYTCGNARATLVNDHNFGRPGIAFGQRGKATVQLVTAANLGTITVTSTVWVMPRPYPPPSSGGSLRQILNRIRSSGLNEGRPSGEVALWGEALALVD